MASPGDCKLSIGACSFARRVHYPLGPASPRESQVNHLAMLNMHPQLGVCYASGPCNVAAPHPAVCIPVATTLGSVCDIPCNDCVVLRACSQCRGRQFSRRSLGTDAQWHASQQCVSIAANRSIPPLTSIRSRRLHPARERCHVETVHVLKWPTTMSA